MTRPDNESDKERPRLKAGANRSILKNILNRVVACINA